MSEFFSYDFIKEQIGKPITGIVHIGAHYAEERWEYHALEWKALWFEAHPIFAQQMKQNLTVFDDQHGYEAVLYDKDNETVDFWVTQNEVASSILKPAVIQEWFPDYAAVTAKLSLNTTRFDTFIESNKISLESYNLLSLDVQGSEDKVWKGIGKYQDQFDAIISEYSLIEYYENVPQLYDLDKLFIGFERVFPLEPPEFAHADALFIRR
jgi:FkbM family methyltransferase